MTTFKAPAQSASFDEDSFGSGGNDASIPLPNIHVVSPANSRSPSSASGGHSEDDAAIDEADCDHGEIVLIPTQPHSQSQYKPYDPDLERHLVGCLIPSSTMFPRYDLWKTHEGSKWVIGRGPGSDILVSDLSLSNSHCRLEWNGKYGKKSEVTITDQSRNGTWVNHMPLKGQTSILRSGSCVSLGTPSEVPNDWRFIYRDIEGQSSRGMTQIWAKYDVGFEVGAGSFARVHRCVERLTGQEYAVKIIDRSKLRQARADEMGFLREIAILKQLAEFSHKHIVTLREHFEEEDAIYLILEYVKGGDLLSYIGRHGPLPEEEVRYMAAQICHAVAYVHSQGIAHRDLKPENIMLTDSNPPECKVADFGLAKLVDGDTFLRTLCGTPAYLAPEVALRPSLKQGYDNRVDSWSLGVIFYCMLTNCAPFHVQYDPTASAEEQRQYFSERQTDWKQLFRVHLSDDGMDFLRHILAPDPRNRKEVHYMLDHNWIQPFVPSDTQFQRLPSQLSTPISPDSTFACSQSLVHLNLDDAIPGLVNATPESANMSTEPLTRSESFTSEASVTSRIPGAFPRPRKEAAARQLPPVDEDSATNGSWNMVSRPSHRGSVRRDDDPTPGPSVLAKRKNPLGGSSPLSSLSPSEDEEDRSPPPRKLPAPPPRSRRNGKAVSTTPRRRTRSRSVMEPSSADETAHPVSRPTRRSAAKAARRA